MNEQVTEYINKINIEWQVDICEQIRNIILQSIPEVEEQIKYNQAFYSLNGKQLCVFFPAKNWVNVTLFNAEEIEAPEGFFEPSNKPERKAVKIREGQAFEYDVLAKCFQQIMNVK